MGHQWIIDVIVDLKSFAQQNELPHLAEELARVAAVADAELDADKRGASHLMRCEDTDARRFSTQT